MKYIYLSTQNLMNLNALMVKKRSFTIKALRRKQAMKHIYSSTQNLMVKKEDSPLRSEEKIKA